MVFYLISKPAICECSNERLFVYKRFLVYRFAVRIHNRFGVITFWAVRVTLFLENWRNFFFEQVVLVLLVLPFVFNGSLDGFLKSVLFLNQFFQFGGAFRFFLRRVALVFCRCGGQRCKEQQKIDFARNHILPERIWLLKNNRLINKELKKTRTIYLPTGFNNFWAKIK